MFPFSSPSPPQNKRKNPPYKKTPVVYIAVFVEAKFCRGHPKHAQNWTPLGCEPPLLREGPSSHVFKAHMEGEIGPPVCSSQRQQASTIPARARFFAMVVVLFFSIFFGEPSCFFWCFLLLLLCFESCFLGFLLLHLQMPPAFASSPCCCQATWQGTLGLTVSASLTLTYSQLPNNSETPTPGNMLGDRLACLCL